MKILLYALLILSSVATFAQQYTIPLKKETSSGLSYVKVGLNGLNKDFIFDTGASAIVINSAVFNELLKANKVTKADIIGKTQSIIANGATVDVAIVQIKNFTVGTFTIPNIEVFVMPDPQAPLLIGQSVFSKFGRITIDNAKSVIILDKDGFGSPTNGTIKEIKFIKCFAKSDSLETEIKNFITKNYPKITISEDKNLPQAKAIQRIKCDIVIRYFDTSSEVTAKEIEKLLASKIKINSICVENMLPFFAAPIAEYIEIWIKN